PGTRAADDVMGGWMDRLMQPAVLRAVQQLKPIAEQAGLTLPQFALAWVLREPIGQAGDAGGITATSSGRRTWPIASAIIGASRPEQVLENAQASGAMVDAELFVRAEALIDAAQARAAAD
uniref:aldo/keto reductase n=1 Tax=Sphingomonas sp. TaxID=28214 RepID=UPI001832F5D1